MSSLTIVGFVDCGGGGGKGEAAEEAGVLTLLPLPCVVDALEDAGSALRPVGGGGRSDDAFMSGFSAAKSFSSVALRSATKSAMSASKSLSSSSLRDSGGKRSVCLQECGKRAKGYRCHQTMQPRSKTMVTRFHPE